MRDIRLGKNVLADFDVTDKKIRVNLEEIQRKCRKRSKRMLYTALYHTFEHEDLHDAMFELPVSTKAEHYVINRLGI